MNNLTNNPNVPTQNIQEIKFPKFISNLGIIPSSYKDSMNYYENLAWLCKYLEETVIPTVNQNGNATQELQNLYVELNSYVTNYFENLDVQEEINNKLDQMVEEGTFQDIISPLLSEKIIEEIGNKENLETDNKENLVNAINEVNSISLNNNNNIGNLQNLNTDNKENLVNAINEVNQHTDNNYSKMGNLANLQTQNKTSLVNAINENNQILSNIENNFVNLKNNITNFKNTIFIGDSYGLGRYYGSTTGYVTGYLEYLVQKLGLTSDEYKIYAENGIGFQQTNAEGNNFLKLLQNHISEITNKSIINNVIVLGGINDSTYITEGGSIDNIKTSIDVFCNYVKSQFPNAKIFIGCLGNFNCTSSNATDNNYNKKLNLKQKIYPTYRTRTIVNSRVIYLSGSENICNDYSFYDSTDQIHPNQNGYNLIANCLYQLLMNGTFSHFNQEFGTVGFTFEQGITNSDGSGTLFLSSLIYDNYLRLFGLNARLNINPSVTITGDDYNKKIKIGTISTKFAKFLSNGLAQCLVKGIFKQDNNQFYNDTFILTLESDCGLYLNLLTSKKDSLTYPTIVTPTNVNLIYIYSWTMDIPLIDC